MLTIKKILLFCIAISTLSSAYVVTRTIGTSSQNGSAANTSSGGGGLSALPSREQSDFYQAFYQRQQELREERERRERQVRPFIIRFYQTILGRTGDTVGIHNWTFRLAHHTSTAADIARGFIFSQEFKNKNTDDVTFLTILYRAFFNRNPDSGGLSYWLYRLEAGHSRYSVLNGFLYSQEFKNLTATYNIRAY